MAKDLPVDRRFDAYQDFVLGCKLAWTRSLYPALRAHYAEAVAAADAPPASAADVAALLKDDPLNQYFGWFERHLQRMKYSGRHGLAPHFAAQRAELEDELAAGAESGILTLDPAFEQPAYYVAIDIHQHPGGVWSDEVAGYVYERGARTTTPLLEEDADLHHRFTREVMARATNPRRLVDLGCGFGKSSRPFYNKHRELDVTGVELSAPCLKLAARTAVQDQARNVRFRQADSADTGLEAGAYDVVTSTMVLHEMPPSHIERTIQESFRLLVPGGLSIHLDFLTDQDPFRRFIHYGHSARNNEPFMPPLNEMDLEGAHRRAGFETFEVVPFAEMPGTLDPAFTAWRFPWTMIIARKPA
ncbi:MAG: class I SAM-dependent methyltransferase [Rhodospirillales bacterium]|nr:class I SAM-dependent methyltransferase [Rhodospirillales bacterium]